MEAGRALADQSSGHRPYGGAIMSDIKQRLYDLLPAIYRIKDAENGQPLNALLEVIEREFRLIESDIDSLYDNWFIETCDEWAVPYLGDLLGVKGLAPLDAEDYSQRAYVANALSHRRRKGTSLVLEQVARDITGWPARAVEFYRTIAVAQNQNHVRLSSPSFLDLRSCSNLEHLDGPFDTAAHAVDVRRISTDGGKYNIKNVGLFLWQMQSCPVTKSTACRFKEGRYWFNPLGYDMPLFNRPRAALQADHSIDEINVPGMLSRRDLYEDLELFKRSISEGKDGVSKYLADQPSLQIFLDEQCISPEEIVICDLEDWDDPILTPDGPSGARVAIDPEMGRLALLDKNLPCLVQVSYSYGSSGDIGGGPYNRRESMQGWLEALTGIEDIWVRGVSQGKNATENGTDPSLEKAIAQWNEYPSTDKPRVGIIILMDSGSYELKTLQTIDLPDNSRLGIVSASWPRMAVSEDVQSLIDFLVLDGQRPHLKGDIYVRTPASKESAGELYLNGLLIEGKMQILANNPGSLQITMDHCTLVPEKGGLNARGNGKLKIKMDRCICGPVSMESNAASLRASGSIIDRGKSIDLALYVPEMDLCLEECTILGATQARSLLASNCIFTDRVSIERQQIGCVRFCYLPNNSRPPRRYHCQPEMALAASNACRVDGGTAESEESIKARVAPVFRSVHYDHLRYGELSSISAEEILKGSEDGSEMGAFSCLKRSQREENLRACLKEYLRLGLDAGIIKV
jgi:hypothetical protein